MRLLDKSRPLFRARATSACRADTADALQRACSARRTAWSSAPARPAAARPRRSTASLGEINTPERNIMTIEDPVEYTLPVDQPDPDQRAGRHHLRRRPASRSCARTPTSSWSARSATSRPRGSPCSPRSPATSCSRRCTPPTRSSALHRLLDMGIEAFLIASSVTGRGRPAPGAPDLHPLPGALRALRRGAGVPATRSAAGRRRRASGTAPAATSAPTPATSDRIGVYELLPVTDEIRELIVERAPHDEMRKLAPSRGHAHAAGGGRPPGRDRHHHARRGHALHLRGRSLTMPKFAYVGDRPLDGRRGHGRRTRPPSRRRGRGRALRAASSATSGVTEKKSLLQFELTGPRVKREEVMHLSRQLAAFIAGRAADPRGGAHARRRDRQLARCAG